MNRFSLLTTADLLSILSRTRGRGRIGADEPSYADRAQQIFNRGMELASSFSPFGMVYRGMREAQTELQTLAVRTAGLPAEVIAALSDRMGQAAESLSLHGANVLRNVASGAGDAYREFFGFPPIVAILLGLAVLVGGGYLLLSPGGQTLLSRGGAGLLEGAGKALSGLALV